MPLAFSDQQLSEITTAAQSIPPALRAAYLERIAAMLSGREFGDGDVRGAAMQARREVLRSTAVPGKC
jgi:hypothetical protein